MIAISVVIPTRNRADLLRKTLESLVIQHFNKNKFEVIVCDNNSSDHTAEVVDHYKVLFPNFKYYKVLKVGLHEGRHKGLVESTSQILTYIDDDVEVYPNWLTTIYNVFKTKHDVVLLGGKNIPKFESDPPFWLKQMWNNLNSGGHQILGELSLIDLGNKEGIVSPSYVFGCNFSIRKEILEEAGGFHPDGMPFELIRFRGDGESYVSRFIKNSNYTAYYHPAASLYHFVPTSRMTLDYFMQRRYNQGISDAYTYLRDGDTSNKKKKISENKISQFFRNVFKRNLFYNHLLELKRISKAINETNFDRELRISYANGFNYLLKCYETNSEIREWIHKKNYL